MLITSSGAIYVQIVIYVFLSLAFDAIKVMFKGMDISLVFRDQRRSLLLKSCLGALQSFVHLPCFHSHFLKIYELNKELMARF
jgi:hypothetical protein